MNLCMQGPDMQTKDDGIKLIQVFSAANSKIKWNCESKIISDVHIHMNTNSWANKVYNRSISTQYDSDLKNKRA